MISSPLKLFSSPAVLGALIGKQTGRHIEIMNSFELSYDELDGHIIINREYYTLKEEQCECPGPHTRSLFLTISPSNLTYRRVLYDFWALTLIVV